MRRSKTGRKPPHYRRPATQTPLFKWPVTPLMDCSLNEHTWQHTTVPGIAICAVCGVSGFCPLCVAPIPASYPIHPCNAHARISGRTN